MLPSRSQLRPRPAGSSSSVRCSSSALLLLRPFTHARPHITVRAAEDAEQEVDFEVAVPMSSPQGSQLAYILTHGQGNERQVLFEPAVRTYLQELQEEREREAAMYAEAEADRAAEAAAAAAAADTADAAAAEAAAAAVGDSSSNQQQQEKQSEGTDASETFDDDELMRRISAVREAERGYVISDILYLEAAKQLQAAGFQLLDNIALLAPAISQPPPCFMSAPKLQGSQLLSPACIDAVVSYMASSFSGGDPELMRSASPPQTPLSVDRVEAARLYAGLLEFGYFSAALQQRCIAAGIPMGSDSSAMIAFADQLPEGELRQLCAVRSADGWWGAVRHIGTVFGLAPNNDPFDSFGLPFPDLAVTISQIQMQPAASIWEHFNMPGTAAKLAAKADPDAAGALPDANLVAFEFGLFQRLLLEAAVFGAVLFAAEQRIEQNYNYKLSCRWEREAHAGQPAM